jgi:hypothetical protein
LFELAGDFPTQQDAGRLEVAVDEALVGVVAEFTRPGTG